MSEREFEILREVVALFLATGEPVASGAVARTSATGLSSPSIRNVMAELEQRGFLEQPHTSAGRVPSDEGLRVFVEELLGSTSLAASDERRLSAMMSHAGTLEEVLDSASRTLADVTDEVGMAAAPALQQIVLRSIHFVQVSPRRALAVLVTQGGLVESRLLVAERDYGQHELDRISNYCTESFAGLALCEIRARLLALMAEERARWDELLAGVLELARQAIGDENEGAGEVFVRGSDRLLATAEPGQLESMRQLFAAFADKALLFRLLNQFFAGSGPRVLLGSELGLATGGHLGLIVSSFELPTGEVGLVGVLGPKRMNYPQIVPVVEFVGKYLARFGDRGEAR